MGCQGGNWRVSCPFPSRWMMLYKRWQGKLSSFFRARAQRSLGRCFQGHLKELSLIRVSFVALGSQSHVNNTFRGSRVRPGWGDENGASVVSSPLEVVGTGFLHPCSFFPILQRASGARLQGIYPQVRAQKRKGEDKEEPTSASDASRLIRHASLFLFFWKG